LLDGSPSVRTVKGAKSNDRDIPPMVEFMARHRTLSSIVITRTGSLIVVRF
jgi:hypothetical protein